MYVILLLLVLFVPAICGRSPLKMPNDLQVQKAALPLLAIGLAIGAISLAVGIYTFLQMRKMQKKNRPKPNQIDGTIADEGVSFCDIAGSPHVHPNITDLWNKKSKAIKQKSGGILGIGKTSQVTGYRYYTSFAAFIGNRIEKFIAINFDNRGWIVHDPKNHPFNMLPVNKPGLFGQDAGGVVGNIDLEFGYPQPQQNLAYKQHFDLVSAYPYQSYLVFRGTGESKSNEGGLIGGVINALSVGDRDAFYFGNSNYMKEMLLWVKRTRVRNDGQGQWYATTSDRPWVCEIGSYNGNNQNQLIGSLVNGLRQSGYESVSFPNNNGLQVEDIPITPVAMYESSNDIDTFESLPIGNQYQVTEWSGSSVGGGLEMWFEKSTNVHIEMAGQVTLKFRFRVTSSYTVTVSSTGDIINKYAEVLDTKIISTTLSYVGRVSTTQREIEYTVVAVHSEPFNVSFLLHAECEMVGHTVSPAVYIEYFYIDTTYTAKVRFDSYRLLANGSGPDINPIHKIREILTDDTAMAKPESNVNDVNFVKAADRIYDEGLGVSWAIDEKSCIDAIEELCYHIEAGIRVNRQTGLYEIVLFRDDWFAEDEIHSIAENKIKDLSLEVMNGDDIVNQLNVTYYDRERIKNSTFSVYENGSILTMGKANAESIEFPYFMNMRNAEVVANWKLKQYSTPAWKGTFTTGWREARKWNRYDLVEITWSKKWQGTILARIMKIDLGNGLNNEVMIDFEEVVPYSGEMNTSIVVDDSTEEKPMPPQSAIFKIFEIPYYDLAQLKTQAELDLELARNPNIGFVAAVAGRPQQNSIDAQLHTESDVGYELISNVEYASFARTDEGVNRTQQSFVVKNEDLSTQFRQDSLIMLGDEIVIYKSYDAETKTLTVERGALDTVPQNHVENTVLYFYDDVFAYDPEGYASPKTVNATVLTTTPSGIESLETSPKRQVQIESRAIRPYPPANVKINGEYFPQESSDSLEITWSHRNKIRLAVVDWFNAASDIENGVTYIIRIVAVDSFDLETEVINSNVGGVDSYTVDLSTAPSDTLFFKLTLKSIKDSYESLYQIEHTFMPALKAPINLTATYNP